VNVGATQILFMMATEAEYGPELARRFNPLFTGVCPVEAASAVSAAPASLEVVGCLPDLAVSLESAGSASVQQTEVDQVSRVSYRPWMPPILVSLGG